MRIFKPLLLTVLLGACASSTQSADAPDSEGDAEQAADSDGEDTASGSLDEESEAEDESADSEGSASDSAPSAPAERLLKQEGTAFLYDFSKSEAGIKAEERCDKSSAGDAAKKANCMNQATKAVKPQGFKFERDKENPDVWWFVRFEIKGTKPIEHNRVKAEFSDDSGKKITIKTTGPDQARPAKGSVPASFEIELPDEYTLIINEPGKGKMIYEPKLGLFDEG
jgi:hypothetical protein